jgi:cell wall-associated protease
MIKINFKTLAIFACGFSLVGCNSAKLLQIQPLTNIHQAPKNAELSELQMKRWGHLDLVKDTIPGMSVERAYNELLKKKKGQTVTVAVIDSGTSLDHEDLKDVLWVNSKEIAGDGIDNDGNGFIDDVHGYNFLGDSYHEQMEYSRIIRLKIGDQELQQQAQEAWENELSETKEILPQLVQIEQFVQMAHRNATEFMGTANYSIKDLENHQAKSLQEEQIVNLLIQIMGSGKNIPDALKEIQYGIKQYQSRMDYNLNLEFDGRTPVGDDPYNFQDRNYGNGNPDVSVKDESHGTHVSGIIAATRNNKKGINGVAQHIKLMSVRAVPDGDEYDKDVALAIRYAVDNGAKVINASFGKAFSPNAEWVYEALQYAAEKDVLFVHAAGNDGMDLDLPDNKNFPNDFGTGSTELFDNYLSVGALTSDFGPDMVAGFSNYGRQNVDIFAPGDNIYSTTPGNEYEFKGGTSMAAPAVSGVAAVIRSHYPMLTAKQVKQIIMQSGLDINLTVQVGGLEGEQRPFTEISRSGKIANLYNAILLAEKVSRSQVQLLD